MSENAENVTEYCLNWWGYFNDIFNLTDIQNHLVCSSKHDVPAGNIQMHIIHCQRNIQLCPVCDERILRSELENHTKEFHSVISCKECDAKLESSELDEHKVHLYKYVRIEHRFNRCSTLERKLWKTNRSLSILWSRTESRRYWWTRGLLRFQNRMLRRLRKAYNAQISTFASRFES